MIERSERWRVGDLAVCVKFVGWWTATGNPAPGPSKNQIVRVARVYEAAPLEHGIGTALEFDEFADELYPASPYFRRIEPDHSPADDGEIVALIKGAQVGARA